MPRSTAFALLGAIALNASATGFDSQFETGARKLQLVNTGDVYYALFVHVYDAALYAEARQVPAYPSPQQAKCLRIAYQVELTRDNFREATEVVLRKQHPGGRYSAIEPAVARVSAAYRDVKPGDEYVFCNEPDRGATLSLNGETLVNIDDHEFGEAYLGIWLGEEPISDRLRDQLLARQPAIGVQR